MCFKKRCDSATTDDFSSPNRIGGGVKRNTSKASGEPFSFVPSKMEIPAEI